LLFILVTMLVIGTIKGEYWPKSEIL
jgi:hypothetical protein